MTEEQWSVVDDYINETLVGEDAALEAVLNASEAVGLPPISVSPSQGKMLQMLARLMGARTILEVGTLGGYSTIWLARALPPGGRLVTLEIDPKHAEVARGNVERAGLADMVDVRLGRAVDTLPVIAAEGIGPFDMTFIDADKPSNPEYFRRALELSRPGSLIIVDNVVRGGQVIDPESTDASVQGVRRLHEMIAAEPRVTATAVQTVGIKGWDGFTMAMVTG